MNKRGSSLIEVVVATGVFLIFMAALFFVFDLGSRAFKDSNAGSEARNAAALIVDRLGRISNQSCKDGVSTSGAAVSFLLPLDEFGHLVYDSTGHPLWQRYRLFYRDGPSNEFRELEQPMSPTPGPVVPLEEMDFGAGPKPLLTYAVAGKVLARGVTSFVPQWQSDGTLNLSLVVEIEQRRGRPPARCEMVTRLTVRN